MNRGSPKGEMDRATFERFCQIAHSHAGIVIGDDKRSLVSARVARRLRALGLESPLQYLGFLENDRSGKELVQYLDTISTNFTGFFREEPHFEFLKKIVEGWLAEGQRSFRFWSAGASTGEEPYSIGMVLDELAMFNEFSYRVLATDISSAVLRRAKQGVYREGDVGELKESRLRRYFDEEVAQSRASGAPRTCWRVKPSLREHIVFARLNLANAPYPMSGPFDVIFCRNVMIYFDLQFRQRILAEVERLLKPGGYLLIGHSETLTGLGSRLKNLQPSVYRRTVDDNRSRRHS